MIVKKLFLFVFVLIVSLTKAQAQISMNDPRLLEGFDEKKAIKELKQKGVDPAEFLDSEKRRYALKRAKELGYFKYTAKPKHEHDNSKTKYINLTTQIASSCPNSDFSQLNFTNWTGGVWALPGAQTNTWTMTPTWTPGTIGLINDFLTYGGVSFFPNGFVPTQNRHVILTTPPTNNDPTLGTVVGYDSIAINPITNKADIPLQPPGSTSALRLGNATIGDNLNLLAETEQIIYSMLVTPSTTQFTYQYAVVLNNPGGSHLPDEEPFFEITVKDQTGTQIGGPCGKYLVTTDLAADTSYHFINQPGSFYNGNVNIYYKNWTTVTIDLSVQMGQNITVEFRTADCSRTGHFGYAYLDAYCGSLVGSASGVCGGVGTSVLNAPPGFSSYQWYGPPSGSVLINGATASTYTAASVNVGDTFAVHMISPSGCSSLIKIGITGNNIFANYSSVPSCEGGGTGSVTAGISGGGNFSYTWINSGGTNIGNTSTVSNLPPGTYSVHIVDNTGTCPPKDSAIKILATHPPLTTTTSQLCGSVLSPQLHVPAGAITPFNWTLNTSTVSIGTSATLTYTTAVLPTDYFVLTYIDPTTHCRDSLKTTLNQVTIDFSASPSPACKGGSNGSVVLSPIGTNTYTTFDWTVNGSTVHPNGTPNGAGPSLYDSLLAGGTYTFVINPTGNASCSFSITANVSQGALNVSPPVTVKGCELDTIHVVPAIQPGSSNHWYQGGTIIALPSPYFNASTLNLSGTMNVNGMTYTDTVYSAAPNFCVSVYKVIIKTQSISVIATSSEGIHCYGDSSGAIKATASAEINGPIGQPIIFNWTYPSPYTATGATTFTTGINTPQSSQENGLHAGTYTVTVKSGNCISTKIYSLVNPAPLNSDTLNLFYCPKDDSALIVVTEKGHPTYTWLLHHVVVPGKTNDSIWVKTGDVNSYMATYLDGGCKDTAKVLITFPSWHALRPDTLVNVFTPNGDNRNDVFYPFYGKGFMHVDVEKQTESYHIYIYNRWGKLVFETEEYSKAWNGNDQSGTPQDDGTYYFILKYKSNCSTKADIVNKKGFVQLLR